MAKKSNKQSSPRISAGESPKKGYGASSMSAGPLRRSQALPGPAETSSWRDDGDDDVPESCELDGSVGRESRGTAAGSQGHVLAPFESQFRQLVGSASTEYAIATEAAGMTEENESSEGKALDAWFAVYGTHVSRATVRSNPEFVAEKIIGPDDRVNIETTHEYPYSAICSLVITASNGEKYVGTGWLPDSQTVITAGHCVFMGREGGWATAIDVYPARNGTHKPIQRRATRLMSVRGWTRAGKPECDYGAIRLDQPVDEVGTFGFAALEDELLSRYVCHIVGYPGDKPGTMWGHARRLKSVKPRTLVYEVDTYGGNSGGPLFVFDGRDVFVVGIHNYGDVRGNSATRIDPTVYDQIQNWAKGG